MNREDWIMDASVPSPSLSESSLSAGVETHQLWSFHSGLDSGSMNQLNHTAIKLHNLTLPLASSTIATTFLFDMNVSDVTAATTESYNMSNASEIVYQPAPTFTAVMLTRCILFGVMFVISFIGNVATLVQMRRLRRRKSTINTLIVHLALADLLVTFFCIAGDAAWVITVQWLAGNFMCKFVKYMQAFALYLSTYITVVISLDRCVAILDPMRRNGAAQRVKIMICFAWIFSALFSIPQTLIFSVRRGPFKQEFYQCVTFGSRSEWQLQLYTIASIMLLFVLPLAIIVTAYALIFTTINRKSKEHSVLDGIQMPATRSWVTQWVNYKHYFCFAWCSKPMSRRASIMSSCSSDPSRGPVRSHLLRKAKKKSLRMSFVIVLAFMICWTPYHIIFICTTIFDMIIDPIIFNYLSFIGLSNSMLNPVIYGAFQLCKVQFYSSSSWRRNAWRGDISKRNPSSNPSANRRTDFQHDTPASSSASRDSRNRLLAKKSSQQHCNDCPLGPLDHDKVYLPLLNLNLKGKAPGKSHCNTLTHKHLTTGEVKKCLCFHSF